MAADVTSAIQPAPVALIVASRLSLFACLLVHSPSPASCYACGCGCLRFPAEVDSPMCLVKDMVKDRIIYLEISYRPFVVYDDRCPMQCAHSPRTSGAALTHNNTENLQQHAETTMRMRYAGGAHACAPECTQRRSLQCPAEDPADALTCDQQCSVWSTHFPPSPCRLVSFAALPLHPAQRWT